jgi:acyl phosphate:glycerol-3-phosphate acyltransferase
MFWFICFLVLTFFFTGIPTGFLAVKLVSGKDIRDAGSGNIGATNVRRTLGTGWFVIVLLLDALKGALPLLLAVPVLGVLHVNLSGLFQGPFQGSSRVLIAVFSILGNLFSPYLGFKGGKGMATSLGALAVLAPIPTLAALPVFIVTLLLTNYVSLSSIITAFCYPFLVLITEKILKPALSSHDVTNTAHHPVDTSLIVFAFIIAAILIIRHKENIQRLKKGEESKFFKK